jgi:hypothetical protein
MDEAVMSERASYALLEGRHVARLGRFDHEMCRFVSYELLCSNLVQIDGLSPAFKGNTGMQVVFTRDGMRQLAETLSILCRWLSRPLLRTAMRSS